MYHPNIYGSGKVCLDILDPGKWAPTYNVESILTSLQSLLDNPNPLSPANSNAGSNFSDNKSEFNRLVREHA